MSSPVNNQFVDFHSSMTNAGDPHPNGGFAEKTARQPSAGPVKFRIGGGGDRRGSFSRKVSFDPRVIQHNDIESGGVGTSGSNKDERHLLRSGKSVGAVVGSERKADFSMFRTKSTLNKQMSTMLPTRRDNEFDMNNVDRHSGSLQQENPVNQTVPAGRYFAALRGPELDQVRDYEDILLPKDEKWPFLLRFPIGCYGISLGLSSQAILWKNLSTSSATAFLHVSPIINIVLWLLALVVLVSISVTYALKAAFYFEAVRREYFHPVRVNFFFAPWIVCMFLSLGVPPTFSMNRKLHPAIWCVFMLPVIVLELKIYGQWLSGGKRRLCKVANPSSHLSIVGNFVGAILAAKVEWYEPAKFLWAVGFAHYLVLFVTLYQRLPTNEALPKELHPVYSMFIAAPSAASIAWELIYGEFDEVSRTCYFIALFLYTSFVVRLNFFRGFRFSVAWWSYTFPMTTASIATIRYAQAVPCLITKALALSLSLMSSAMVSLLFISTLLHAFLWRSLFPNDLAIAITKNKINGGGGGGGGGGSGGRGRQQGNKEKKGGKKSCDIRKWTKQSPLSALVSFAKNGKDSSRNDKESDEK